MKIIDTHIFIFKRLNLLHTRLVESVMLTGADLMSNDGILFRTSPQFKMFSNFPDTSKF
jgi:hypothetical protein